MSGTIDTDGLHGAGGPFPPTRHSAIGRSRSLDAGERQRALGALIESYWKPAYKHVRLTWHADHEEAQDLVQGFFAHALARDVLQAFDPARARFRTWLRLCLDGFVSNERKAAGRQKRGGGLALLSLDFAAAEDELTRAGGAGVEPAAGTAPGDVFDREWTRSLFELALERLRRRCGEAGRDASLTLFLRHDLVEDGAAVPSYAELAVEAGQPVTQVTHQLGWARREFRVQVLAVLRDITGSDEEFRDEARQLLGIVPT